MEVCPPLQTRGGPQVSSRLGLDAEFQISEVKWYESYPQLNTECVF